MEAKSVESEDVSKVRNVEDDRVGEQGVGGGVDSSSGLESKPGVPASQIGAESGEVGAGAQDVSESVEPYWRAGNGVTVPEYRPKDGDPLQPPKSVGFEDKGFHASECWRMDLGPQFPGHF